MSVKGTVSETLFAELLAENPSDKSLYNKMTKYFTITTRHDQRIFCSAHYGTELYITGASDDDMAYFKNIMHPYTSDAFSIAIDESVSTDREI